MAHRPQRQRRTINWSAVTSLITAFTAVGALIFTGLSLNATRDQIAVAQGDQRVAQQGQFTDRYSRAIEQLGRQGADQLQIRLGGIYALERLARDSPRDQPTIIQVLATFVRTSTPTRDLQTGCLTTSGPQPLDWQPPPDVQAALDVLGHRDKSHDNGTTVNLRSACLGLMDLRDANLRNADLTFADFGSAGLSGADLSGADLTGVNLSHAELSHANLAGANLNSSNISFAILAEAKLNHVQLVGADLSFADFGGSELRSSNLSNVDLGGANLAKADLVNADLTSANLTGANVESADLTGVNHENTVTAFMRDDNFTKGRWW